MKLYRIAVSRIFPSIFLSFRSTGWPSRSSSRAHYLWIFSLSRIIYPSHDSGGCCWAPISFQEWKAFWNSIHISMLFIISYIHTSTELLMKTAIFCLIFGNIMLSNSINVAPSFESSRKTMAIGRPGWWQNGQGKLFHTYNACVLERALQEVNHFLRFYQELFPTRHSKMRWRGPRAIWPIRCGPSLAFPRMGGGQLSRTFIC